MKIIEGIIVFGWLIYMSGFFGYNTLLMFNYDPDNNSSIKNIFLYILIGSLYFIIGVPLIFYIKSLL